MFRTIQQAVLLAACLGCTACACALDSEDRAAGKPPLWQCFAANSLRTYACKNDMADSSQCTTYSSGGGIERPKN